MLTEQRKGEIAMLLILHKSEKEGTMLKSPKELRRSVSNAAKTLGITPEEGAEFMKIIYESVYSKSVAELDKMISGKK